MSRKDSGSAGPFMGSSRGGAPCSKQRRPPGLRKSDTPPWYLGMCATLLIHIPACSNSIKRSATSAKSWPSCRVGIVNAVILLPSITSIAVFDGGLKARGRCDCRVTEAYFTLSVISPTRFVNLKFFSYTFF